MLFFWGKRARRDSGELERGVEPAPAARADAGPASAPRRTGGKTPPAPARKLIGQLMVDEGLITPGQLQEALSQQQQTGKKVVETLIDLGYVTAEKFERFVARQPGVASIDLDNYRISEELIDLIPKELVVRHQIFPIDKLGKLLTVGMACPLDAKTIAELQEITGLRVKALLCSWQDIEACIKEYYLKEKGPAQSATAAGGAP